MRNAMWVGRGIRGMGGIPMLGTGARGLTALIRGIFRNNEQGFFYDPNDLSTMYQDAAGTTPVTAVGQPVGLVLDKSKGLALGANYLNTATLDFTIGWSSTASVTAKSKNSFTVNGSGGCYRNLSGLISKVVRIRLKGRCGVSWTLRNSGDANGAVNVPAGEFDVTSNNAEIFKNSASIYFIINGASTLTLDSISVDELKGNHAYQTTSAARPILQQTPILGNELVVNGDTSNGTDGWITTNATLQTIDGSFVMASSAQFGGVTKPISLDTSKTYELTFTVIGNTTNVVLAAIIRPASTITNYASVTITTAGKYKLIFKPTEVSSRFMFQHSNVAPTGSLTFDDVSIKEITGYRTDQNYLAFDGVDDFLQTNNIDFTATDKVSLFTGVRRLSDAAPSVLVELSASIANVGTFNIQAPRTGNSYGVGVRGSTLNAVDYSTYTAPISNVISLKLTTSATNYLGAIMGRFDGVNTAGSANSSAASIGNYGNYPLYIGRRGGTYLPFNGHLYSLIGIGKLTSDSETLAIEKELAKRIGVTLSV